jgi:hypothetical protein
MPSKAILILSAGKRQDFGFEGFGFEDFGFDGAW